jgi:flagellar hook-length control protein FliK/flagellar hook-basal body complex protein FliE
MATDQLFSMLLPQNPTSGIYRGKLGPSDSAHPAKLKTNRESYKAEGESFLSTLKRVSQNADRTKKSACIDRANQSETKSSDLKDKMDATSEATVVQNEAMSSPMQPSEKSNPEQDDQIPIIRNLMDIFRVLEDMGVNLLDGGSDGSTLVDGDPANGKDLAVAKWLLERLQRNEPMSSDALNAAIEQLQQFIAGALEGNTPIPVDENTGNGQWVDLAQNPARLFQWLQELAGGLNRQNNERGMGKEASDPIGSQTDSTLTDIRGVLIQAADSIDLMANSKAGVPGQAAEIGGVASQSSSSGTGKPEKEPSEKLSPAVKNPNETTVAAKPDADPSKPLEEKDFWRDTKIAGRLETAQQIPADRERRLSNNTEPNPASRSAKHSAQAEVKPGIGSPSNSFSATTAVEEPVSRMLQEFQELKDVHGRVSSAINEETGGKIIKTEVGTNDTGLLNSQNPPMEKPSETVSLSKEVDSDRSGFKTQTLDQIVHKAAIHLKNGQHEARIELKPEYLGHIRMQVTSENHHVTVKILAEHGFVKDMIENHAHQLKADLQQQGLNIDKLEVTVSRDSDDSGNPKERLSGMRTRQGAADNGKQGNSGQDLPQDKRQWRRTPGGATMVDYFA